MPFCSYCGSHEPEETAFCSSCGQSMTMPPVTAPNSDMLKRDTVTQAGLSPTYLVNMPRLASETEEKRLISLAPQKAAPHDHDGDDHHYEHHSDLRRHWRWSYRRHMASRSGARTTTSAGLVFKVILIVAIAVGAVAGVVKVTPYVFHPGSNSAPCSSNATAPTVAAIPTASSIPTAITPAPLEITSGPDGNLWFTENGANKIGRITPAGTIREFSIPTVSSGPEGITSGPDGNLWFTAISGSGDKIGRITPAGTIREFSIPTVSSGLGGITSGPDGNLWFTEYGASKIGRITPAGTTTEFSLSAASSGLPGITSGHDGNLWFTEQH